MLLTIVLMAGGSVLIGILPTFGLVGWLAPGAGASLKPIADTFINLIKMCVAPIIFCTVVMGIGHVDDFKSVGRIGLKR